MAGQQHKSKKELERESRELELTERRVRLALSVIPALTTLILTLATVISPFLGAHWMVPTGTSIGAGLTALGGRFAR
ncbi:MAG: hypothetical protein ACLP1Q_20320 [Solirubrobacteraceae bacterium]